MRRSLYLLTLPLALAAVPACGQERAHTPGPLPGKPAPRATLAWPSGLALDGHGRLYVADRRADRVYRVDLDSGALEVVAGSGERGFSGDGGPATEARIAIPETIAFDTDENLYIADRGNARVRRVDAVTGVITTVAGTGEVGYGADGGPATRTALSYVYGVHVDDGGDVYIADTENHAIRVVDAGTGRIRTVAGIGEAGFSGDGGPADQARLRRPHVVTVDPDGDLVIGDSFNQRIRRVDLRTGRIETLYGSGERGASPDGIPAREASFAFFGSLVYEPDGDLLVAGWLDGRIRRIDAETGIVTTVAGNGDEGFGGDDVPALEVPLAGPYGMGLDQTGNLYVAEAEAGRVRRIDGETGVITTVTGTVRE